MRKIVYLKSIIVVCLFLSNFTYVVAKQNSVTQIESGFKKIPDSIQTSVYWYWMSDNISKEGAVKDLEAMKRVGINRAFIGNIGGQNVPYGNVKMFSSEWWEILHIALRKAAELDIEIGIFNSPGWSQSGGPWVKANQAMRYLKLKETKVKGPRYVTIEAEANTDDFQPVNVFAYKAPVLKRKDIVNFKISSEDIKGDLEVLTDGLIDTKVSLQRNKVYNIFFNSSKAQTVRSLVIQSSEERLMAKAKLFVKQGDKYVLLKDFGLDRSRPTLTTGFVPYAPIVEAIPHTNATDFKLEIYDITIAGGIAGVELSARALLERFPEKSLAKMHQTPLPYWHEYMWERQPEIDANHLIISEKSVVDISSSLLPNGTIRWKVPAGEWVIVQTGMAPTGVENGPASPEATGHETDKMSKEHIRSHFDAFLGEIKRRIPANDRRTWKVVVQDSYEMGGQNWTDDMKQAFKQVYGYDPLPYLLTLNGHVVGSRDKSDRFLWDLRRFVADKIAYDYVGGLADVSHENGLTTWLENYGHWGFPGEFLLYGKFSDEVAGEFWSEGKLGDVENRAASSCAHIYGKVKVSSESFTSGGKAYSRYPATIKPRGDKFFTEGINNTLLHFMIQQPDERRPGFNAPFGNEFNRHNTWFEYLDLFNGYLKRTNFMLQQGKYVADVAYFIGEDVPKMTGVCDPALPKGYSFDYMNADVIMTRMRVVDGYLTLPDGMKYRMLVLPRQKTMRPELLKKIKELIMDGAVVVGEPPVYSPSLANYPFADKELQKLANEVWGDKIVPIRNLGKGKVMTLNDLNVAFENLKMKPDCYVAETDSVLFIHRHASDVNVYYLSNQHSKSITIHPTFRINGLMPELWHPVTGEIRKLPQFKVENGLTQLTLKMDKHESYFVVFRDKSSGQSYSNGENFPAPQSKTDLSENWILKFNTKDRGPKNELKINKLFDWSTSGNDSIKYYSGEVTYKKQFNITLSKNKKYVVDLGSLTAMAKVKLNNQYVGGVWTAPYALDVTKFLVNGENTIEITVVNNWMNRLIGDQKIDADKRPTFTIIMPYKADTPLQPSGLFGPVVLNEFSVTNN